MKRFLLTVIIAVYVLSSFCYANNSPTAIIDNIHAMRDFTEVSGLNHEDSRKIFEELGCSPVEGMQKYRAFMWGYLASVADYKNTLKTGKKYVYEAGKTSNMIGIEIEKVANKDLSIIGEKFMDKSAKDFNKALHKVGVYDKWYGYLRELNPNRGGTTGAHGFTGEIFAGLNLELDGNKVEWINDNGAADLKVNGKPYQLKIKKKVPMKDILNPRYNGQVIAVQENYVNLETLQKSAQKFGKKVVTVPAIYEENKMVSMLRKLESYVPKGRELNAVANVYEISGIGKTGIELGGNLTRNALDAGTNLTGSAGRAGINMAKGAAGAGLRFGNVAWQSGIKGLSSGAVAGGAIGGLTNLYYVVRYGKDVNDAIVDTAIDEGTGALAGAAFDTVLGVVAATETGAVAIGAMGSALAPVVAVIPVMLPYVVFGGTCYYIYDCLFS